MPIISLTVGYKHFDEKVSFFCRKEYFDTSGCHFEWSRCTYENKEINCSIFNGKIVKETPEEILRLIKEAENEK